MTDEILPLITKDDYPAFQPIIEQYFPDAYKEWPDKFEKWHEKYEQQAKERRLLGHTPRPVQVSPKEFAEFCRHNDCIDIFVSLLRYAHRIAGEADEAERLNTEYFED